MLGTRQQYLVFTLANATQRKGALHPVAQSVGLWRFAGKDCPDSAISSSNFGLLFTEDGGKCIDCELVSVYAQNSGYTNWMCFNCGLPYAFSMTLCLDHKSSETSPAAPATKLMTARTPNAVVVRATCLHLALKLVLVVLVLCQSMQISSPQPISNQCFIILRSSSLYHIEYRDELRPETVCDHAEVPTLQDDLFTLSAHWPGHRQCPLLSLIQAPGVRG